MNNSYYDNKELSKVNLSNNQSESQSINITVHTNII